jgi:hypothetical protein
MNYAGSHEMVRMFPMRHGMGSCALARMEDLADRYMADHDEDGWKHPAYKLNAKAASPRESRHPSAQKAKSAKGNYRPPCN